ncbi:MAG: anaerobic sulfatase maturase [Candidatus Bathyarchaeota archaeon]|nr:anaerobic sulfatase maturase [Candidatus Bathyarchaeota archaeon]
MPRLPAQTCAFHVMAKPTGSRCNLSCDYCFFTKKHYLYPQSSFVMPDNVMQAYIRQTIQAHSSPSVTFAWQGGEPTLMGLDFYRRSLGVIKDSLPAGVEAENTLQTNGVLLDEEWCRFLHDNNFLVGISIDGPRRLHDIYRKDKAGNSVFDRVIDSVRLMQKHQVEFNVLCTVNAQNSQYPLEVYRFFRDQLKTPYLQFIPIVERDNMLGNQQGSQLTERTVKPEQYGRFLIDIFDEWVRGDVGEVFVLTFEAVLMSYLRGYSSLCVLSPRCGENVALEHNGDVYSCDHYVEPDYLLGNILQTPLKELILSKQQTTFGEAKSSGLPRYCKQCLFLFTCYGECPKNRVLQTPDGEEGLNWLCTGLKAFFVHSKKPMQIMAALLRMGQPATDVMEIMREPEWSVPAK